MDEKKFSTVSIPTSILKKIKNIIEGTGFASDSSRVTYILRDVIAKRSEEVEEVFSIKVKEKVKERLHDLGYLD